MTWAWKTANVQLADFYVCLKHSTAGMKWLLLLCLQELKGRLTSSHGEARESNKYFSKCSAHLCDLFLDVIIQQINMDPQMKQIKMIMHNLLKKPQIFLTWKLTFNFSAVFKGHTVKTVKVDQFLKEST